MSSPMDPETLKTLRFLVVERGASIKSSYAKGLIEAHDMEAEVADMLSELLIRATKRADAAEESSRAWRTGCAERERECVGLRERLAELVTQRARMNEDLDAACDESTDLRTQLATLRGDLIR